MFFFPTRCQEKLLRVNLQPTAAFPPLWAPSCSPAILLAKPKSSLQVLMTLSHLQHSQLCSHLLAPGLCLAGTLLTAFGEAHSPPMRGGARNVPLPGTSALQAQSQQPPLCWCFGKAHVFLPLCYSRRPCHLSAEGAAAGCCQGRAFSSPQAGPSLLPYCASQHCQVVAVTSHPRAAVSSHELLLQREVTQRQSRERGDPCVRLDLLTPC